MKKVTLDIQQGILVRVGADFSYGRTHSPGKLSTRQFVYVPIPEKESRVRPDYGRAYSEIINPVRLFLGDGDFGRFPMPSEKFMHLDPDFEHLTYGDNGNARGSGVARLKHGDFIAFYAAIRPYDNAPKNLIYALIGLLVVDKVMLASEVPDDRWHENAHTRRATISPSDVVVFGDKQRSGLLDQYIEIGSYRNRAYRVLPELLETWGGLSVHDGFIQRSVRPPQFLEPARFLTWFGEPKLNQSNWKNPGKIEQRMDLGEFHEKGNMNEKSLLPPWLKFTDIPFGSIGWRMGEGEDYSMDWHDWYGALSREDKAKYQEQYPEPKSWVDFYRHH